MVARILAVVSGPVVVPVALERRIGPSGGHGGFRCRRNLQSYRALRWFRWLIQSLNGSRIGPFGGSGGSSVCYAVVSGSLVVPVAKSKVKWGSYRALWWFRWLIRRLSGSRIGPSGGSGGLVEG